MFLVRYAVLSAIVIGLLANVLPGKAQQQALLPYVLPYTKPPETKPLVQPVVRSAPSAISKTQLATRFQNIKSQYAVLKMTAVRHVPAGSTDTLQVKQARLQLASAMRSYEYYEGQTQIHRDNLNTLTALSETESMRMQIALDRMTRLQTMISNLVKTFADGGDTVVQNTN